MMETALEALITLQANAENLTASQRSSVLALCRAAITTIEASEVFEGVRNAGSPGFQFSSNSLKRLAALLNGSSKDGKDKISTFQDLDAEMVIIYGLSMSIKDINRMKMEAWNEVARQGRIIAKRIAPYLAQSAQIEKVVNESSDSKFQIKFENMKREYGISDSISGIVLEHLAQLSINGRVALYMPEGNRDGYLRITTRWNEVFFHGLFGDPRDQSGAYDGVGLVRFAYRNRVAQFLGVYTSGAMTTSDVWAQEPPDNMVTNSVRCQGFPGQVIVIDVTIGRPECLKLVELLPAYPGSYM
ncbi:hypothetical protein F66182_269 [Fusarium sp. NRRL 66182]|nr:hypothetical protein F66182_269 [Fusarium sp. NRRL 66182]